MNKSIIISVVCIGVAAGAWYWFSQSEVPTGMVGVGDVKDLTYSIQGQPVTLVHGHAETDAAPGSSSKVVTNYFGNEVTGDLSGDGISDVALILTQNSGGSGTFYYVAAAITSKTGYTGTEAVLLGDRIAPQTTEIKDGKIIVNYAERKLSEPMTTPPSVGKTLVLKLDASTMQLGEVVQGFEGEANSTVMTLSMKTWNWVSTKYSDGTTVVPNKPEKFTLTFKNSGSFSASTDCNGVGGEWDAQNSHIVLSKMMSTLMYCDGSQEADFAKTLTAADQYHFTSKGELVFDLKLDSGTMLFR